MLVIFTYPSLIFAFFRHEAPNSDHTPAFYQILSVHIADIIMEM